MVWSPEPCASSGGRLPEALFLVFRLESQGANVCKSCRRRQELSNEYLVFTCKRRLRYSRERSSQSLKVILLIYPFGSLLGTGGRCVLGSPYRQAPGAGRGDAIEVPVLNLASQFKLRACQIPNFWNLISNSKFPNSPKMWRSMRAFSNSKVPGKNPTKFHQD